MLSPVRLSSVVCLSITFVHPTHPVEIFSHFSSPFSTLAIHWHPRKFYRDRPKVTLPSGGGVNARGVAKYSDFGGFGGHILETVQGGKLVLITNRKMYMSVQLVPKSVTLNDLERRNGPYCVILPNLVVSGAHRRIAYKSAWQSHNYMDNLRLLCLVVNVCKGTARRPRYKYYITARWKFCSRFINSRLNAQYLPSYRLIS